MPCALEPSSPFQRFEGAEKPENKKANDNGIVYRKEIHGF